MALSKQCVKYICQIFVKLLPVTGLKEIMLLMTNDNLFYCMF
jgi:hypothetical protein